MVLNSESEFQKKEPDHERLDAIRYLYLMKKGLILCVDDEPYILVTLKSLFRRSFKSHHLEFAENANDALDILKDYTGPEHGLENIIILSDWKMPGMRGDEFLKMSKQIFPEASRFLLSGMITKEFTDEVYEEAGIRKIISKPWDNDQLLEEIAQVAI